MGMNPHSMSAQQATADIQRLIVCTDGILNYIIDNPQFASNPAKMRGDLEMSQEDFNDTVKWIQDNRIFPLSFQPTND
jgi:hypothetical protein